MQINSNESVVTLSKTVFTWVFSVPENRIIQQTHSIITFFNVDILIITMDFAPKVEQVWNKGNIILGYDSNKWRMDVYDSKIQRNEYGNRESIYGWEIDHIDPNGGDDISNLQPLQWENNVKKGNGQLQC